MSYVTKAFDSREYFSARPPATCNARPSSCMVQGMKRTEPDSSLLPTQAAQSLAVAVALVFLAHMVFWMMT